MTPSDSTDERVLKAAAAEPLRLQVLLEAAGWTIAGGRAGAYSRLTAPLNGGSRAETVVLPLDRQAPEFESDLDAALRSIRQLVGADTVARTIAPRLLIGLVDELRSRKETNAPGGLISWTEGESFIASTRAYMLAGAKSYMEPRQNFRNAFSGFASRYLDTVFMGQTEPGSYVVAAYAPAEEPVTLHGGVPKRNARGPLDSTVAHEVTLAVGRALEAASEALEHFKSAGSLSGFTDLVSEGVSRELVLALKGLASNSAEADISIDWSQPPLQTERTTPVRLEFAAPDAPVFEKASNALAIEQEPEAVSLMGHVHLLTRKELASPGTIGVDVIGDDGPKKVRVRVQTNDQYHVAVASHDLGEPISLRGNLQREGNLWWLYNAELVPVAAGKVAQRQAELEDAATQLTIDDLDAD